MITWHNIWLTRIVLVDRVANDASLLENGDYDGYDGYEYDINDLNEKQLAFCNAWDIHI